MADAAGMWDALGDEIWRQYVDLDSQAHGPSAYDRGLGKGSVEPGYLEAMARGHRFVRARLGAPLTEELYLDLARECLPIAPHHRYRVSRAWVHVHRDRVEPGIDAVWREHGAIAEEGVAGVSPTKLRLHFARLEPDAIRTRLVTAIDRLHADLARAACCEAPSDGRRDARIAAITRFHHAIELLHPTSDGNTRRHALLLYKLLVEAGERPAIMTEINDVYVRTPETWARMVVEGMRRHHVVEEAVASGEDVEEAMRAFDARGLIGQARRLGVNRTRYEDVIFVPFAGDAAADDAADE